MKHIMVRKLNTIISLWLLAIIIALVIFGYELGMIAFYIVAGVLTSMLLGTNAYTLVTGVIISDRKALERQARYKKS